MEAGEKGLSVSWREHFEADGRTVEDVLGRNPKYTLVGQLRVSAARRLAMRVKHDPTSSEPLDCAHALVDWPIELLAPGSDRPPRPERQRIKMALAPEFEFIHGEVKTPSPPGN
jgi:hypothetical protein